MSNNLDVDIVSDLSHLEKQLGGEDKLRAEILDVLDLLKAYEENSSEQPDKIERAEEIRSRILFIESELELLEAETVSSREHARMQALSLASVTLASGAIGAAVVDMTAAVGSRFIFLLSGSLASGLGIIAAIAATWIFLRKIELDREFSTINDGIGRLKSYLSVKFGIG